jgi:hypothetical protein
MEKKIILDVVSIITGDTFKETELTLKIRDNKNLGKNIYPKKIEIIFSEEKPKKEVDYEKLLLQDEKDFNGTCLIDGNKLNIIVGMSTGYN